MCLLTLPPILAESPATQATAQVDQHKVIAPKGILPEDGHDVLLWHDYGSFGLYRVTRNAWLQLPDQARSQAWLADEMDLILLDRNSFDSQRETLQHLKDFEVHEGKALHLIQFVGPIKDEWLKAVETTGTELIHYIANNSYLVWTDGNGRRKLHLLAESNSFLQYSAPFPSVFKLSPTLSQQQKSTNTDHKLVTVTVQIFRHEGQGLTESVLNRLFVDTLSPWEPVLKYQNIVGIIHSQDIKTISQLPDVVWVGERIPREQTDEIQGQIMANSLNPNQTAPSEPGYLSWLSANGFSTNPNDYPIVDITDDGIGNGVAADAAGDDTLRQLGASGNSSRLSYIANCTTAPNGGSTYGHGHINVSIAGGYDNRPGIPFRDAIDYQRGLGINPYGRFAGTRVFYQEFDLSGCGGTDRSLIQQTFNRGAQIVSNSWGASTGIYDEASQIYDAGVRDADSVASGNQELFVLFSAGNGGPYENSIGSPGNGKNMLTVGASENVRPTLDNGDDWIDGCGIGSSEADNVQDIADFSSRGPAPGGRTKPDLVAPGTHILGAASTNPNYDGSQICDKYHPDGQQTFAASSGTSHSTPAVAGFASLAYSFIQRQYGLTAPSPALLKGYLIAHTSYLSGDGVAENLPGQSQGYGLPDMSAAFDNTRRVLVEQTQAPLFNKSGETWSLAVSAADPSKPVHVVLAYTDQPGVIGTDPQVNDLDLTVQADGSTYLGNHMTGQWSILGGSADKVNNIEAVFLPSVKDTSLQITVTAFNIAGDGVPGVGDSTDQDFTLVCTNCLKQKDFTMSVQPASNSICLAGDAQYSITLDSVMDFTEQVTLQVVDFPPGVTNQFSANPIEPPNESLLTVSAAETTTSGTYSIAVEGDSATRHHQVFLDLNLFSTEPGLPVSLDPNSGTINLPVDVTLSWAIVSQAASYDVQIALDPSFDQLVEKGNDLITTSFEPANLQSGQIYYWRVRAQNNCGAGSFTNPNSFTTKPLPGACSIGVAPEVIYSTDFESEDSQQGWTHGGVEDTWSLNNIRYHTDSTSYHAQNLDTISNQTLTSPSITLPPYQGPITLQFWNYQSIESNEYAGSICFDGAILEISTDDGTSWEQLGNGANDSSILLTDPYDGIVKWEFENPVRGLAAWCGDPQDWLNSVVRLDTYSDQTVRFRFRLGTDQSIGNEGWYVDDVRVQVCPEILAESYLPKILSP